jgi:hypothetical protein
MSVEKRNITIWYGKLADAEPFPDLEFWQSQSDETKFAAAWQMVVDAHALKGEDLSGSRLEKSRVSFRRREIGKYD